MEVTKLENLKASDLSTKETSDLSSSDERNEEDQLRPQRKKLRSRSNFDNVSPASKKRRSELDKLLDAGLSSFHCETAKQAAERLGPLQVDVSDNNSGSEASCYDDKLPKSKNSRLLQEADVNQNSKGVCAFLKFHVIFIPFFRENANSNFQSCAISRNCLN